MGITNRERIVVGLAAVIFFAAFGTVALLDRPHGSQGEDFGQDDFTATLERDQGHIVIPDIPSDLLMFGADQEVSLDFNVINNDEDNDIDTIFITIPGAEMINATRRAGGRIVAVGSTSVRTLESAARGGCGVAPGSGMTDLYIRPGYRFHVVQSLITNFHLPRTTLLALLAAFAGPERWRMAYEEAIRRRYRFYSFGDAMLIR